jgi:hypothetical protein
MAYRNWKPSKTKAREYAQKMKEIEEFCSENGIHQSSRGDSYYFTIDGQAYRVSNHTVEASNRGAFTEFGEQIREKYHEDGERDDTIYITAGKTRIMDIYNDLKAGYELDRRGYRKEKR